MSLRPTVSLLHYGVQQRQQPPDKSFPSFPRGFTTFLPQAHLHEGERLLHYGVRLGWEAGHLLPHVYSGQKGPGGDYGVFANSLSVWTKVSSSLGAYSSILLSTLDACHSRGLLKLIAAF